MRKGKTETRTLKDFDEQKIPGAVVNVCYSSAVNFNVYIDQFIFHFRMQTENLLRSSGNLTHIDQLRS